MKSHTLKTAFRRSDTLVLVHAALVSVLVAFTELLHRVVLGLLLVCGGSGGLLHLRVCAEGVRGSSSCGGGRGREKGDEEGVIRVRTCTDAPLSPHSRGWMKACTTHTHTAEMQLDAEVCVLASCVWVCVPSFPGVGTHIVPSGGALLGLGVSAVLGLLQGLLNGGLLLREEEGDTGEERGGG